MLQQLFAGMLVTTLAVGSASDKSAMVYAAESGWILDDSNGRCSLVRTFSSGDTILRVDQSTTPRQDSISLVFESSRPFKSAKANGFAQLEFGAPLSKIDVPYQSWRRDDNARFTAAIKVKREQWRKAATAPEITVIIADAQPFVIASDLPTAAFERLAKCEAQLLDRVGFVPDPNEGSVAESAQVHPSATGYWITDTDFPRGMSRGQIVIGWIIGTDGLIQNCRSIADVDVPEMSKAACEALTKRAKYIPAKDEAGRPVRAFGSRTITLR